jgi:soluble lytic murein transglycosylase
VGLFLVVVLVPVALAQAPVEPAWNPAFPGPGPEPGLAWDRERLGPHFGAGALKGAKEAFDQRRYVEARTLLAGVAPTPPVRYLAALAASGAQDFAAAGAAFESLATEYPVLRDRCLLLAAEAFEALKQWPAVERVAAQVGAGSRLAAEAALARSRALRRLGRPREAAEVVRATAQLAAPPWGRDLGAQALLELAEGATTAGEGRAAREALLQLWSRHPVSPEARQAEARLGEPSRLPDESVVTRGEGLIEAHRNAEGEALLTPLLGRLLLPDGLGCRARYAVGRAQRKQRAFGRAVATLTPVTTRCLDPDLRLRALYTLGVSQTYFAPERAAATFEALASEGPAHALADDALLLAAEARQRQGQGELALGLLTRLVDEFPQSEQAADALFRLFWQAHAGGREVEALAFLDELEGRVGDLEDGFEADRARYWRGRVLESLNRAPEALAGYEALALEHPASYYGLIARERVEGLTPERGARLVAATAAEPEAQELFPVHPGPLAQDATFLAAVELMRLGLGEQVTPEILAVERASLPRESMHLLVLVLSLSGEERAAHALARLWLRPELTGPITRERRALWEIAYPRAYRDLVVTRSREAGSMDPDLLQALMREESALDPRALSWAGALGLCQLMPGTAAEVAARLKLPRPKASGLFDPDLNIRLGGWYLANLLRHAGGATQFALAGYNAGEATVARWRRELGGADLAAWVEQIPIPETRGYVRRVLRSYATYKLLYDPRGVARTVQLPANPSKT